MSPEMLDSSVDSRAGEAHQEVLEQVRGLLESFSDSLEDHTGMRDEARLPVCVQLQVTPCNSAYVPIGPEDVAFAQNLSGGGAALLFAETPMSDFLLIRIGHTTMVLRLLWKRKAGKFVEAGGAFVARF